MKIDIPISINGVKMSTDTQKMIAAALLFVVWLLAIVMVHFYPDVSGYINAFITVVAAILSGLGIDHINNRP